LSCWICGTQNIRERNEKVEGRNDVKIEHKSGKEDTNSTSMAQQMFPSCINPDLAMSHICGLQPARGAFSLWIHFSPETEHSKKRPKADSDSFPLKIS